MALEIGWIEKGTVEGSNFSTHRVLKDDCFMNENNLFYNLFTCVVYICLLECYLRFWDML